VKTLAAHWTEWIASVPLMMYIAVASSTRYSVKDAITYSEDSVSNLTDKILIVAMFFCMIFGCMLPYVTTKRWFLLFFALSFLCQLAAQISMYMSISYYQDLVKKLESNPMSRLINGLHVFQIFQVFLLFYVISNNLNISIIYIFYII